ncbi:hypothetical protein AB3S75_046970 [Citrus x aurantiifolia]
MLSPILCSMPDFWLNASLISTKLAFITR